MRPFLKSIIFVFYFTSISVFASSIDFFYTLPPNDNPNGKGPRPNLIREIDAAKKTLEGSFFQISDPKIADAFIRAKKRGVSVTLTTDAEWYDAAEHGVAEYVAQRQKLEAAGVQMIDDGASDAHHKRLQHNKYCIIDRGTSRARVWMGSTNITPSCSLENGNLSFLIRDSEVADIFYLDFKQMVEGKFQKQKGGVFSVGENLQVVSDQPSTINGLDAKDFFGLGDAISYPSKEINGSKIEFYFAPLHNIQKQVVEALYSAQESIHFATYTLDNAMIYQTIMNKALTDKTQYNPYNIYPVAIREEPWQNIKEGILRTGNDDGTFSDSIIPDTQWKELISAYGGKENEGKFYNAATYFYPPGELGGRVQKVYVYGIFNRLGATKGPYQEMLNMNIPVRMAAFRGMLHHKFIIIDRKILILGSYNFSTSAENTNDESAIIIRDPELVEQVYQEVFAPTYKNAYPEYAPPQWQIDEFPQDQKPLEISEILFDSPQGTDGRYVELYNPNRQEVDITGWKLWNGNIPWYEDPKLSGTTDDLVSYYNDPLNNTYGLNHPEEAYFLHPELQTLEPGEYGLIVGRDFKLEYLEPFLEQFSEQFEAIHGRKPKEFYEFYPKLFVCSDPGDSMVGNGLMPYNFVTLFYPDKFTISDRFDVNGAFSLSVMGDFVDFLLGGGKQFKLKLSKGQSLERIHRDFDWDNFEVHQENYASDQYALYWYGLRHYSKPSDWEPNKNNSYTPGFSY
ncbi:MAG: hypothetical protein A2Z91_05760 [Deltaproteobacteria bacterium GWA2_38_16]|nr:MAG: hypothetical protein A2Z91_05760 [Deltaproteobacteria bacterium GWA2_38_16]OGQ02618.1 MAG: hypothetical protein A3D19_05055 [Deltaproteobacteria bacterium RIFCSPHIGHO2_02_FULL_38_15]OGQ34771.1 MAG: hypothetical protein A3A72_05220 [Deltaproteobacteria bacterium RIFCSPLOWO2_01_FULL_38_9]HBQ20317.1 hypothetical protein [Deltaproteobacteria bacterium]